MSSTLLEVTRASHEEIERFERLIVKDLQKEPSTSRERLSQNHRVRTMIDTITSTTQKLVEIYEDNDNARKDEIAALGGQTEKGTNVFNAFYDRLKEIREYHRRHPNARVIDASEEYEELLKEEPHIEFSGEEGHGKYLDMHELYNEYINSKFGKHIEYSVYLDVFSQPNHVPRNLKLTRTYREYLEHLLDYLIHFFQRIEPLQDLDRIFSKVETEFEELWADGKIEGWKNKVLENGHIPSNDSVVDLDYYSTVEELMEVGPEKLKEGLAALGLKTGGTVKQRAERLFLTKHTPLAKLDKKHFAKGSRDVGLNGASDASQQTDDVRQIALMETKLKRICELLSEFCRPYCKPKKMLRRNRLLHTRKWNLNAKRKRYKPILKVMTRNNRSTILSSCQWAGMGSPFHTGYTSFMDLARNSSVRYVGTTVTGVAELLNDTLRSGAISMECVVLVFPILRISTKLLQLRKPRRSGEEYKNAKE
ncbi:hypothetical protein AQUCO_00901027v1 [Aquilegia coerulea]|uniref:SF3A3 domain-containing protein n=1 Tax=Aquilegia coerulea TaxID=218851 RepID=A0A2G5EGG7_AQUCA|nr:hypothetical protein AQUCO_00901027v1 [Aquilegia coerulea]